MQSFVWCNSPAVNRLCKRATGNKMLLKWLSWTDWFIFRHILHCCQSNLTIVMNTENTNKWNALAKAYQIVTSCSALLHLTQCATSSAWSGKDNRAEQFEAVVGHLWYWPPTANPHMTLFFIKLPGKRKCLCWGLPHLLRLEKHASTFIEIIVSEKFFT